MESKSDELIVKHKSADDNAGRDNSESLNLKDMSKSMDNNS